jgi:predicted RNase H-like nuclease (RuvC/YqgF family)
MHALLGGYVEPYQRNETELERLRRELREAQEEIERLRRKLGSNHPDGLSYSLLGFL